MLYLPFTLLSLHQPTTTIRGEEGCFFFWITEGEERVLRTAQNASQHICPGTFCFPQPRCSPAGHFFQTTGPLTGQRYIPIAFLHNVCAFVSVSLFNNLRRRYQGKGDQKLVKGPHRAGSLKCRQTSSTVSAVAREARYRT